MVFQITGEKRPSSEMMKPKPKPQKKKKKKDPNEPTKPVSAYALFFRDTQAAIKGQNPNATFGDVSKIVASMWDGLGEEQKQVDTYHLNVHLKYTEFTVWKKKYSSSYKDSIPNPCWLHVEMFLSKTGYHLAWLLTNHWCVWKPFSHFQVLITVCSYLSIKLTNHQSNDVARVQMFVTSLKSV